MVVLVVMVCALAWLAVCVAPAGASADVTVTVSSDPATETTTMNITGDYGTYIMVEADDTSTYPMDCTQDGCDVFNFVGGTVSTTDTADCASAVGEVWCSAESNLVVNGGDGGDGIDTSSDCFNTVTMNGNGGDDNLGGGESFDGPCAGAPVQTDTLNGGAGDDKLYGGPGDDVIHGGDGADLIDGGPGNDQIFGDGGDDLELYGGPGNDVIHGGDGNDRLGDQLYPVGFSEDTGADTYYGDAGDDTLTYEGHANAVNVSIDGVANDGSAGEGDNVASDIETVDGSEHDDVMTGGPEADTFDGEGGNDTISGGAGNDTLYGGSGDDTIDGGPGLDALYGDESYCNTFNSCPSGNDTLNADDGEQDRLDCGPGGDVANVDTLDIVGSSFTSSCEVVNVDRGGGTTQTCPAGQTGTPPNCTSPTQTCPSGQVGTPPNCTTPSGVKISLSLPSRQKPVKHRHLLATVGCSAACYAGAFAEVKIGHAKPFEVDSNVIRLTAAGHHLILLTFSKKELRKLKAALRAHVKITVSITGELTNAAGTADYGETRARSLRIKS